MPCSMLALLSEHLVMADERRNKKPARDFTTVPASVLGDTRITALELRCLMVIALHDGMSKKRGAGAGCYARYSTLADKVRTDVTNFSKAVSHLLKLGYVIREQQPTDRRRYTLRVIYEAEQYTEDEKVGEATNIPSEMVGEFANKVVGEGNLETRRIPPKTDPQYIPLNGEIDFDKSREIDSVETANFACREMRHKDHSHEIEGVIDWIINKGKDRAEAQLGSGHQASIMELLPSTWPDLPTDAQLSHFERAFAKLDRRPSAIQASERKELEDWLFSVFDNFSGEAIGHRAERLLEEMAA